MTTEVLFTLTRTLPGGRHVSIPLTETQSRMIQTLLDYHHHNDEWDVGEAPYDVNALDEVQDLISWAKERP